MQSEDKAAELQPGVFYVVSALFLSAGLFYVYKICSVVVPAYDLGLIPLGSDLILHGGHLYRDLHTVMLPGSYLWLAFLFSCFGVSMSVCQVATTGTIFGCGLVLLLIARKFVRSLAVFIPSALLFVLGAYANPYSSHHWDSLFLVLLFVFFLLQIEASHSESSRSAAGTSKRLLALACGLCGGLAVVCYQSQLLPVTVGLAAYYAVVRSRPGNSGVMLPCLVGALLPVVSVVFFSILAGDFAFMLDSTITFVLKSYSEVNRVAYGWSVFEIPVLGSLSTFSALLASLPYGVVRLAPFLVLAMLVVASFKIGTISLERLIKTHPALFLLLACSAGLFIAELHKPDFKRLLFGEPLLWILLLVLAAQLRYRSARILISTTFVLLACGLVINARTLLSFSELGASEYKTARGAVLSLVDLSVLSRLSSLASPEDTAVVYPYDTGLLFLSGLRFPGRFPFLQYGYHSPEQFRETIESMEKENNRFVVVNLAMTTELFKESGFGGYERPDSAKLIFEPYLRQNFKALGVFGNYKLYIRER